jgi:predicted N-acyltransferase
MAVTDQLDVSSLHVTFNTEQEWHSLAPQGMLQRTGIQ